MTRREGRGLSLGCLLVKEEWVQSWLPLHPQFLLTPLGPGSSMFVTAFPELSVYPPPCIYSLGFGWGGKPWWYLPSCTCPPLGIGFSLSQPSTSSSCCVFCLHGSSVLQPALGCLLVLDDEPFAWTGSRLLWDFGCFVWVSLHVSLVGGCRWSCKFCVPVE